MSSFFDAAPTEDDPAIDLDLFDDILVVCDETGTIVSANSAAAAFFGVDRTAMKGSRLAHWSAAGKWNEYDGTQLVAALMTGTGRDRARVEWRFRLEDGRTGVAELNVRHVGHPDASQLRLVSLRDVSESRRTHAMLRCHTHVLRMLANGHPLPEILGTIAQKIEREFPSMHCAFLRIDAHGKNLRVAVAPTLPDFFLQVLDNAPIGPGGLPCGTVAFTGESIIVPDIGSEPQWSAYARLAQSAGFRSSWSEPLVDSRGQCVGVLEIYHRQRHQPSRDERELIGMVTDLASVTIECALSAARLEASEQRFRTLVMGMENMAVQGYDADRRVILWNTGSERLYGYSEAEALGQRLEDLIIPPPMREAVVSAVEAWVSKGVPIPPGELALLRKDGQLVNVFSTHEMQRLAARGPEMYCVDIDLTERKKAEQLIWYQANYDLLTGLANRHLFIDRLRQQVLRSMRSGEPCALLYMDVDDFKPVNDTLGHEAGDQLLREVAERMTHCTRKTDMLARVGGDEFTLIVPEFADAAALVRIAYALREAMAEPFKLDAGMVWISLSIGIATCPDQAQSVDDLIRHADHAMYEAKRTGKNNFAFYD